MSREYNEDVRKHETDPGCPNCGESIIDTLFPTNEPDKIRVKGIALSVQMEYLTAERVWTLLGSNPDQKLSGFREKHSTSEPGGRCRDRTYDLRLVRAAL